MDQAGFTQASLGNAVGMSQPSVWKLTSGKHAIRANFLKYQKCLEFVRNGFPMELGQCVMRELNLIIQNLLFLMKARGDIWTHGMENAFKR